MIECRYQWHFEEATLVNLTFNLFNLERGGDQDRCDNDFCCLNDYVKLTFFKRRNSESYVKVCGEHKSLYWHRKKVKKITLEFATDASETRLGFNGTLGRAELPPTPPPTTPIIVTTSTTNSTPTAASTEPIALSPNKPPKTPKTEGESANSD